MQKACTIKSLSQYINKVNAINIKGEMRMFPPRLLFRGLSNCRYDLIPALGRYPSESWINSWLTVEKDLVQTAQQKFPILFPDSDYPVIRLAKLQHYGIPTRMMDVTENALVALYFACLGDPKANGEVVAFSGIMCSAYDAIANAIADTYRLTGNAITDIENYHFRAMSQPYSTRLLYPNWETNKKQSLNYFINSLKLPIFIETGTICERQKNQGGKFILFPNRIDRKNHDVLDGLVRFEKSSKAVVKRMLIPYECKNDILTQLKRFGMSEAFLFADDVDKVCKCVVDVQRERYPS